MSSIRCSISRICFSFGPFRNPTLVDVATWKICCYRMASELCLEMLWRPTYDPSKFSTFWFVFKAFRVLILVDIATLNFSVSNDVGVMLGNVLEAEFWTYQCRS